MPYMIPTYPENIRLLGPSSWEEIEAQQTTDKQTTGIPAPPLVVCTLLQCEQRPFVHLNINAKVQKVIAELNVRIVIPLQV